MSGDAGIVGPARDDDPGGKGKWRDRYEKLINLGFLQEAAGASFALWRRRNPPSMPACGSGMLLARPQNTPHQVMLFGRKML